MQIIVTSDSHGKGFLLNEIEKWYPNADLYLNLGDLEENPLSYPDWIFVRGNNDYAFGASEMPDDRVISLGKDNKLFMCHGHNFPYYQKEERLASYALSKGYTIVAYGHTHIASVKIINGVLVFNPGSLWMSRNGKSPSFAVLTIEDNGQASVKIVYQEDWPEIEPAKPKARKKSWFRR